MGTHVLAPASTPMPAQRAAAVLVSGAAGAHATAATATKALTAVTAAMARAAAASGRAARAWQASPRLTAQRAGWAAAFGPLMQRRCACCESEDRTGGNASAHCEGGAIKIEYKVPTNDAIGQCIVAHEEQHRLDREECCKRLDQYQKKYGPGSDTSEYDQWHQDTSPDTEVNAYLVSAACMEAALKDFDRRFPQPDAAQKEERERLAKKQESELLGVIEYQQKNGKQEGVAYFIGRCPFLPDGTPKDAGVKQAAEARLARYQAGQAQEQVQEQAARQQDADALQALRLRLPALGGLVQIKGGIELEANWDPQCNAMTEFTVPAAGLEAPLAREPWLAGKQVYLAVEIDRATLAKDALALQDLEANWQLYGAAAPAQGKAYVLLRSQGLA
jgi:hypothetical protein